MERGRQVGCVEKRLTICAGNIFSKAIDICQTAAAAREGRFTDACHSTSDGDGGQATAITEGMIIDGGHAVWDGDGGQAGAIKEGTLPDGCHTIGDGGILATHNQSVCCCFYDGITVVPRIIGRIACFYLY